MKLLQALLSRRRMVITAIALLGLMGASAWRSMVRQEDPSMPSLWGRVVVVFPGADAESVERLIVEPMEEALAEVDELADVQTTAAADVASFMLELRETLAETDEAWDEIREAVAAAELEFPEGVMPAEVVDDLNRSQAVVLAFTGSVDPQELNAVAERAKDRLLALPQVSKVEVESDPGEQITIELDDAVARRLGVDPLLLSQQLAARNRATVGGSIRAGGRRLTLRPESEFRSVEEIAQTQIQLPSGSSVPLREIARVRLGPEEPAISRMRVDGQAAVGVGIVPREGVNVVDFGRAVRGEVEELRREMAPLEITEVVFQPQRVEERLEDLGRSLLFGVLIVAAVVMMAMGPRLGFIVASVVPMVVLTSLAFYAVGGGVLHQISVAALVIALGMLVDNAIVVAESIQTRLDRGEDRTAATTGAVHDLAVPLASATGTTLAVFVPMLAAEGVTAVFTRAIPVVIMLTLTVSYLFALVVTPMLAQLVLRRRQEAEAGRFAGVAAAVGRLAVSRPIPVLAGAALLVGVSGAAVGGVRQQFFPESDRNQVLLDITLPAGAHLDDTDSVARRLERTLAENPGVVSVASFVGRSVPKFYYNLLGVPQRSNLAQIIVNTTTTETAQEVQEWVRGVARADFPEIELVSRKLQQGPSVLAPVEVRLYSEDLTTLAQMAPRIQGVLEAVPGTADVRHDMGIGVPTVEFDIDDAAAGRLGLSRSEVALAVFGRTRGIEVGQFRGGEDPIPMVLRSSEGDRYPVDNLAGIQVAAPGGTPVPLAQVASLEIAWKPAAIHRRNGRRLVSVLSELRGEATFSDVLAGFQGRMAEIELPPGVELEIGGDAESSGEANQAMASAAPLGALLLIGILLAEFNSFRRVSIILITVPLAAVGVIPGLLLADQPFGFMSLLGVIALIGVVVNNAIVLIDVVERRREEGAGVSEAIQSAVERRTRPILLATATTVAGLMPLAFSSSTFWPPLAWAMISGLLGSTFLTLLVVPALYRLLFEPRAVLRGRRRPGGREAVAATVLLLAPLAAPDAVAQERAEDSAPVGLSLARALEAGRERPTAQAADALADALSEAAVAERRAAFLPVASVSATALERDRELLFMTAFGPFRQGRAGRREAGALMIQPLLDPARLFHAAPAARREAEAARFDAQRTDEQLAATAGVAWLAVAALDARLAAVETFLQSLDGRLQEVEAQVGAGRALEADALKVRLALDGAKQDRLALQEARRVALLDLSRLVGAEETVVIDGDGFEVPRVGEEAAGWLQEALTGREDLRSLDERLAAARGLGKAVKAERLPRLEATLGWSWTDADVYTESSWLEGTVGVRWTPFAAGTRAPRYRALQARARGLEAQRLELLRQIRVEVESALASMATARGALEVGERGVAQATETLRVETERFTAGRITTNDLLDAEAALRDQRTRRDLARIDLMRSWLLLRLACGEVRLP